MYIYSKGVRMGHCSYCAADLTPRCLRGVLYNEDIAVCSAICLVRLNYVWRDTGIARRLMTLARRIWKI